jgi:hypothetical protein
VQALHDLIVIVNRQLPSRLEGFLIGCEACGHGRRHLGEFDLDVSLVLG